ncbi:putative membrane protein YedE/YeeE [Variovorax boronicumulans]|uniref:YeeE/YedE family protein n=1 Tax=Variovorax boronicumulans TaxID=436515 RepID=UPI0027877EEC|nr:YeeE/YedE family protein [Variovorax boronicumulans]MDP9915736.1 putative membrane protein YedE/YeeE [Variovorax boronicumulans]
MSASSIHAAPVPLSRTGLAAAVVVLLLIAAGVHLLGERSGGRALAFALGLGAVLGVVLQRSRFCFYCHARDYFEGGDARGLLAIVAALAVGTVGMHVVMTGWLPVPQPGRLPPDAHIGPVSGALVLAGLAFGAGMVVSGSCISAHWYRLGEGSPTAPFALLGAGAGFLLGFTSWNWLYSATIATAPVVWLPHHLGYAGSAALQLVVLAALAAGLWRKLPVGEAALPTPRSFIDAARRLLQGRWPYAWGGLAVGAIAVIVVLRLRPLGVTAALGSAARELGNAHGLLPQRLDGLDGFGGCVTAVVKSLWQTPNALLAGGLVAGALAAALASGQFKPAWPTVEQAVRGLGGGVLLGWGAMTGLGCTVGNLLSGTMAGALSGWVFGASVLLAVWGGLRLKRLASRA